MPREQLVQVAGTGLMAFQDNKVHKDHRYKYLLLCSCYFSTLMMCMINFCLSQYRIAFT